MDSRPSYKIETTLRSPSLYNYLLEATTTKEYFAKTPGAWVVPRDMPPIKDPHAPIDLDDPSDSRAREPWTVDVYVNFLKITDFYTPYSLRNPGGSLVRRVYHPDTIKAYGQILPAGWRDMTMGDLYDAIENDGASEDLVQVEFSICTRFRISDTTGHKEPVSYTGTHLVDLHPVLQGLVADSRAKTEEALTSLS